MKKHITFITLFLFALTTQAESKLPTRIHSSLYTAVSPLKDQVFDIQQITQIRNQLKTAFTRLPNELVANDLNKYSGNEDSILKFQDAFVHENEIQYFFGKEYIGDHSKSCSVSVIVTIEKETLKIKHLEVPASCDEDL